MALIAFDFETSGIRPEYALQPWRMPTEAWATSLVWQIDGGEPQGGLNPTVDDMRAMLQFAIDGDHTLAAWNATYDISILLAYGLENEVFKAKFIDGMLLWKHYAITSHSGSDSYGLKECVAKFIPDQAGYEENIDFHDASPEARAKLHEYNIKDTQFTLELTQMFAKKLTPSQLNCAKIEAEALPLIAQANLRGMYVDVASAEDLRDELTKTIEEMQQQLIKYGVTETVVRSPKQLAKLIYDDWGLPCTMRTNSGAPSTNKEALKELAALDNRAMLLKEFREALNNRAKFAQGLIDSAAYNGGKTYPNAKMFGTYSGRLTYKATQDAEEPGERPGTTRKVELRTGFPLHQAKRDKVYRQVIVPPEGYTIVEFDAASQEFRLLALASNDKTMQSLCAPGKDPHQYMGDQIQPNAQDKKAARQLGKLANLALGYRTGAKRLLAVARVNYNLPMELPEAEHIHRTYQQTYTQVPVYWQQQINKVKAKGYVETYAGRRVQMDKDRWADHEWAMGSTAINYRIQGTGADQKFLALKYVKPYLREIGGYFAWDLHDGLYFYIPDNIVDDAVRHIKQLLDNLPYKQEWGFSPAIPLPWDCKTGKSWGDLAEYKFEKETGLGDQSQPLNPMALPQGGDRDRGAKSGLTNTNKIEAPIDQVRTTNVVKVDFKETQREHALQQALILAAAGVKVFPCQNNKRPAHGFNDWEHNASSDAKTIRDWFTKEHLDATMVGMPCGTNDLLVLDPDVPKPGKDTNGLSAFLSLLDLMEIDLAGTPVVISPSGGRHYIFAQPKDGTRYGCTKGLLPAGIDVKGDGGYVIAIGSARDDGLLYADDPTHPPFLPQFKLGSIPQLPDELAELLKKSKEKTGTGERMSKELLQEALDAIPNDDTFKHRDDWQEMGHAIWGSSGGDAWGRELWLKWSASWDNVQKDGAAEEFWDGVKKARSGAGYIRKQLERLGEDDLYMQAKTEAAFADFEDDDETIPVNDYDDPDDDTIENVSFYGDARITAAPHIVEDLIPETGLTFIGGQSGAGKTFIAIDLAVSLASGKPFAGKEVKKMGGTIYLAAEGEGTIHRRIKGAMDALNFYEDPAPIAMMTRYGNLADPQMMKKAVKKVKRVAAVMERRYGVKAVMVIVDTLVASFSMEKENDGPEMQRHCNASRQLGDAIGGVTVVIHHFGKDATTGFRGSSGIRAEIDKGIGVLGDRNEIEGTCTNRKVVLMKNRDGEEGYSWHFDLKGVLVGTDDEGEDIFSASVIGRTPVRDDLDDKADLRIAVMEDIKQHPQSQVQDRATRLNKARPALSMLIKRMKEDGLIRYNAVSKNYTLTKTGERQLKEAKKDK